MRKRKCSHYLGGGVWLKTWFLSYNVWQLPHLNCWSYPFPSRRTYLFHYHVWHHQVLHWDFLLDDLGINTKILVVQLFGFYFYFFIYVLSLIYSYFDYDVLIQILDFDIYFKFILRQINCCTLIPSYLGNVSLKLSPWTSIHRNPLYCVLLHCLFDYPVSTTKIYPSLTLLSYSDVVIVAVIIVGNQLLGMCW